MFRLLSISIVLFLFSAQLSADLRVMAINAEWLWTPKDGIAEGQRVRIKDMKLKAYNAEIAYYATLIRRANADLVAFSEIENQSVVDDLVVELGFPWKGYFRQGRDTATGQDVAIVSRLRVVSDSVTDFGFPTGRFRRNDKGKRLSKVLGAVFTSPVSEAPFAVLTSHFLSRRNDSQKKANNRLRQAYAVVVALQQFDQDIKKKIVLGDLNDHQGSAPLRHLMEEGGLRSMIDSCPQIKLADGELSPPPKYQIDHILFSGFECYDKAYFDLGDRSDHYAVWALLK